MNHKAAIHAIKSKIGMTEDDYRALLMQLAGETSSKDCNPTQLAKVRTHFYGLAQKYQLAKPKASPSTKPYKAAGRPTPTPDRLPLVKRIRAQLISLGRKPDTYADSIAKQMWGDRAPQFYEWGSTAQLQVISTALTKQQNRTGAATGEAQA